MKIVILPVSCSKEANEATAIFFNMLFPGNKGFERFVYDDGDEKEEYDCFLFKDDLSKSGEESSQFFRCSTPGLYNYFFAEAEILISVSSDKNGIPLMGDVCEFNSDTCPQYFEGTKKKFYSVTVTHDEKVAPSSKVREIISDFKKKAVEAMRPNETLPDKRQKVCERNVSSDSDFAFSALNPGVVTSLFEPDCNRSKENSKKSSGKVSLSSLFGLPFFWNSIANPKSIFINETYLTNLRKTNDFT